MKFKITNRIFLWLLGATLLSVGSGCSRRGGPVHESLFTVKVTEANYVAVVEQNPLPVLLDFWATWCPPCLEMLPHLDKLAESNKDRLVVAKVDVDEEEALSEKFKIEAMPTLVIMKGGTAVDTRMGYMTYEELVEWLAPHLPAPVAAPAP